MDFVETVKL